MSDEANTEPSRLAFDGFDIPADLIALTGSGPEAFAANAEGQLAALDAWVGLAADFTVLEIGCGVGRCAIPLARVIGPSGRYIGIDIIARSIEWAQRNITARYPQFTFIHFDVRDDLHNPDGVMSPLEVRLPAAKHTVDRVVLWSVLTHLHAQEIKHYLDEIRRVLKPDGRAWASCFIVNDEILASARKTNLTPWDLRFDNTPVNGCYINNLAVPRGAIAYTLETFEAMAKRSGLRIAGPYIKGIWSGFHETPQSGQDGIVLVPGPATLRNVSAPARLSTRRLLMAAYRGIRQLIPWLPRP